MIRVLHFAGVINRHDIIDVVIENADARRFQMMAITFARVANIADPDFAARRVPHWIIDQPRRVEYLGVARRLARLLKCERIHILHTHHYEEALIGWLATRLCPQTRLIVGRHYSDAVYRLSTGLKQKALLALENLANRAAVRIIVPSTFIRDLLVERQSIAAAKVSLIHFGFEPRKYRTPPIEEVEKIRREQNVNGHVVLGIFGRIDDQKGHKFLLEALAQLRHSPRPFVLWVVGEGAERATEESHARSLGLGDRIRFLGWRRDAMTVMAGVDAVVQPTLQEAFSQVMVEALWLGKPLIITDVSGAPDIITDGQNGLLIPKEDVPALATAIERLVRDEPLRNRLGTAGREYVEKNLAIEKIIPRYEEVYCRVMEEAGRR